MEQVKKQLLILQRKKKEEEYVFKTEGAKKQASFVTKMTDWIKDDLRSVLESEYGPLPDRVSSVISSGESVALERLHLLKIADTYGWGAVTEFTAVELARNELEEKKLKKIIKKNEEKLEKAKSARNKSTNWRSSNYVPRGSGNNDYRRDSKEDE